MDNNSIVSFKMQESNKHSYKYDVLHELAHAICGWSCCKEHAEWEAHGGAKLLAYLLDIDIGDAEERMRCYAKISSREACGRYKPKKRKTKKVHK